ncbi:vWA domain-containing protein [Ideonella sp. A 288]|uniref:vWA domain-containing protein n=1 Tax=Ideonella sp. A 288 TaxID=1962181 RepID=UPI0013036EC8|nr:vWA domain-containing protein [Ideonella sp. A 288]
MSFGHAWVLWLLPLAALPWLAMPGGALSNAWPSMMSRDTASELLRWALRALASLAIAALVVALAEPYRPEYEVERVGKGAEIVLLLDRSRSMDQGFAGAPPKGAPVKGTGPEALDYYFSQTPGRLRESKGKVARQLLADFAAKRPDDLFGMIVFSTLPIRTLEFTQKHDAIRAAIEAGNIGRGLSETNIGLALQAALSTFEQRAYTGSRIALLVSDGGDRLDPDASERITHLARKHRVAIYWLYLRSANSPGLMLDAGEPPQNADSVPEVMLHRFFQSMGTPYRAYEAGTPQALQKAIESVNQLENLPITYLDTVPRRDLWGASCGIALACVALLLAANWLEIRRWA